VFDGSVAHCDAAQAQQYGGYGAGSINRYRSPGSRAKLSPFLNLARGNDPNINSAIDYYLGTIPERERRSNENIFGTRIRGLETRQRELFDLAGSVGDIPPVPIAGAPIGSRSSASYFRQDGPGNTTHRSPRLR